MKELQCPAHWSHRILILNMSPTVWPGRQQKVTYLRENLWIKGKNPGFAAVCGGSTLQLPMEATSVYKGTEYGSKGTSVLFLALPLTCQVTLANHFNLSVPLVPFLSFVCLIYSGCKLSRAETVPYHVCVMVTNANEPKLGWKPPAITVKQIINSNRLLPPHLPHANWFLNPHPPPPAPSPPTPPRSAHKRGKCRTQTSSNFSKHKHLTFRQAVPTTTGRGLLRPAGDSRGPQLSW